MTGFFVASSCSYSLFSSFYFLSLKLIHDTQVAVIKEPHVIDSPLEHGDPIDTSAKREALVFLWINTRRFEHFRMHHSRTHDLDPAATPTNRTRRINGPLS